MKRIENTPENKEKFIALYWRQKVAKFQIGKSTAGPYTIAYNGQFGALCEDPEYGFENAYLELKSLSQISDEDATRVAQIVLNKPIKPLEIINWDWCYRVIVKREPSFQDENTIIEMFIEIHYESSEIKFTWDYLKDGNIGTSERHCPNAFKAYQYLISKGYYVGDGTEIEYGWVKLKEESQDLK